MAWINPRFLRIPPESGPYQAGMCLPHHVHARYSQFVPVTCNEKGLLEMLTRKDKEAFDALQENAEK